MTNEELLKVIEAMSAELKALKSTSPVTGEKKNQKPGKPTAGRKYVLLSKKMADWGKVPQQQRDLADIISKKLDVDEEISEVELFAHISTEYVNYPSLANSTQDPTYLFRYYRGLKNDQKHAGFVGREFIQQID